MSKLIRHFSIPSLMSIALVTAGLSMFYRHQSYQILIKQQEQQSIVIARIFANSIWYKHQNFLKSIENLEDVCSTLSNQAA